MDIKTADVRKVELNTPGFWFGVFVLDLKVYFSDTNIWNILYMMHLIKFPQSKNSEIKINYFLDFFSVCAMRNGQYSIWEFETPLSVIDKIIFQIEYNPKYKSKYLTYYLKNHHLKENTFTNEFKNLRKLRPYIAGFLSASNGDTWLRDEPKFLVLIKRLRKELETKMIQTSLKYISRYLLCSHTLEEHKDNLSYFARLIISELKFRKKSDREIERLVKRLLSREVGMFPLPSEINNIEDEEEFLKKARQFIKNRNFKEQFEGISNFADQENIGGYYLIKIFKLQLEEHNVLLFNDVEIRHPEDVVFSSFINEDDEDWKREKWENFIKDDNISIGMVREDLTNYKQGKTNAIGKVQEIVSFINTTLNLNAYLGIYDTRITRKFESVGTNISTDNSIRPLSNGSIKKLRKANAFLLLFETESQAKSKFIEVERYYQRAIVSGELADFWHYLECLIPSLKKKNGKLDKQVKTVCAAIMILNYKLNYGSHICSRIFNLLITPFVQEATEHSISTAEQIKLDSNWTNTGVIKTTTRFKRRHPIISSLHEEYKLRNSEDKLKSELKYYYSIFNELFEIRNAYIHGGTKNHYADMKLKRVVPPMVACIRMFILTEIKKGRFKKMDKLAFSIRKRAKSYTNIESFKDFFSSETQN